MKDYVYIENDEQHVAKEKAKARDLRQSQWWKQQLALGVCHYCQKKFSTTDELTMDHIVPVSRGGRSIKGNVVVCCKVCNNQKKYLTPAEILLQNMVSRSPEE